MFEMPTNRSVALTNDQEHIVTIIKDQREFFKSGRTYDIGFRIEMLKKFKNSILRHELEIVEALKKDLRKPTFESYLTEMAVVINEINIAIKNLKKWARPKKVKGDMISFPSKSYIIQEPYGVALVIGTWNFPFNLTFMPLVGSIAAGNCSIVKPSEVSIHSSSIIAKIINSCFDKNYIFAIEGDSKVSEALLNNRFDKIFFTGGPSIGKIVMRKASEYLTSVTLELGGKSPCILDKQSDLEKSVQKILWGKCTNAGQICIAPDYLIVHKEVKQAFYEAFKRQLKAFYAEDPSNSEDFSRIINLRHFHRLTDYLKDGRIVIGGDYNEAELYISPTVMEVENLDSPVMREEIFGPILPVVEFTDYQEIETLIARNPNPLALYIFSKNKTFIENVISRIPSGGVCVNDTVFHITNEHLPFGGRGTSGIGSYHGKYSFETFSHSKSVMIKKQWFTMPFGYPPYKKSHKLIKQVYLK